MPNRPRPSTNPPSEIPLASFGDDEQGDYVAGGGLERNSSSDRDWRIMLVSLNSKERSIWQPGAGKRSYRLILFVVEGLHLRDPLEVPRPEPAPS